MTPKLSKPAESDAPIGAKALAYLQAKERIKELNKTIADLRQDLEAHLEANKTLTPEGHEIATVTHAGVDIRLMHTARNSTYLQPDALETVKASLPQKQVDRMVETIEVLREDALEVLVENGEIPSEVTSQIFGVDTVYAFSVSRV